MSQDSLITFGNMAMQFSEHELNRLLAYDDMINGTQQYLDEPQEQNNEQQIKLEEPLQPPPTPQTPLPPPLHQQLGVVSNDNFSGEFDFDLHINTYHGSKAPFVFSSSLFKLFAKMNENCPIDFKYIATSDKKLYVRAMPIYCTVQNAQYPVERCVPHALGKDPSNIALEEHVWGHIIRCQHPCAIYEGDRTKNERLSVRIPLEKPQAGMSSVRYMYTFVCQNSCPSGMNRRPLEVVFTLEDEFGTVLGRKTVSVRVCSCPKRDKDKEEKEYHGTKVAPSSNPIPATKKRKLDKKPSTFHSNVDNREYELNFKVYGKENAKAVLKYAQDLMAGEMYRHGTEQPFKQCILEIGRQISFGNLASDLSSQ